jgi:hypothetical protein
MSTASLAEVDNDSQQGSISENHVQFATYRQERLGASQRLGTRKSAICLFFLLTVIYAGPPPRPPALNRHSKTWNPLPLRLRFWIPLVVILVGAAIGLEIALYVSNKHQGGLMSYIYLMAPQILILAGWAATALHYAYVCRMIFL